MPAVRYRSLRQAGFRGDQSLFACPVEQRLDTRRCPGLRSGRGADSLALQLPTDPGQGRLVAVGGVVDGRDHSSTRRVVCATAFLDRRGAAFSRDASAKPSATRRRTARIKASRGEGLAGGFAAVEPPLSRLSPGSGNFQALRFVSTVPMRTMISRSEPLAIPAACSRKCRAWPG
jgi:hypothetical protein